jgi:hypothetical protein
MYASRLIAGFSTHGEAGIWDADDMYAAYG